MELHEFMCPEVFKNDIRDLWFSNKFENYPSPLLMLLDPQGKSCHIKSRTIDTSKEFDLAVFGEYKPSRNFALVKSINDRVRSPFVSDLEDCRSHDTNVYLNLNINVIQYNRRVGSRTGVLWQLPNYYEPSSKIGALRDRNFVDEIKFLEKIPKVFWRGDLSGSRWADPYRRVGVYRATRIEELHDLAKHFSRPRAVFMSKEDPNIYDMKFSGATAAKLKGIDESGLLSAKITPSEQMQYKYILCPNGNDVASQTYWVANTRSVIFKEDSDHEVLPDFFLKPWVHYVPISKGLTDLREKFEYCERNVDLCLSIIARANEAYSLMTQADLWTEAEGIVLDRLGLA